MGRPPTLRASNYIAFLNFQNSFIISFPAALFADDFITNVTRFIFFNIHSFLLTLYRLFAALTSRSVLAAYPHKMISRSHVAKTAARTVKFQ